jgi:hypothetical protein
LRASYFEKAIDELLEKLNLEHKRMREIIWREVMKGKQADLEEIINLFERYSAVKRLIGDASKVERSMARGIFYDLASIAIIILVSIMVLGQEITNTVTIVVAIVGYFVFINIWNFAMNIRSYQNIKGNLKETQSTSGSS